MKRWSLVLGISASIAGCATLGKGDLEALKPAVQAFHQSLRWKDFRGAGDLMVPERRDAFVKARMKANDERDLFVTEFELEDAKTSPDGLRATVVSKLSWYRLPSSTVKSATMTTVFVWRDARWLAESQDDGPFPELLPEILPRPVAASSSPDAG